MGKINKTPKMNMRRFIKEGHKKDMWFSVQKSKDPKNNIDRIYIREVFYNKAKCTEAVKNFNENIIGLRV